MYSMIYEYIFITGPCSANRQNSLSGSHKQKTYSVGLGRRRTSGESDELEDPFNSTGRKLNHFLNFIYTYGQ